MSRGTALRSPRRTAGRVAWLLAWTVLAAPASAYETDQYSHRLVEIADSRPILSELVNQALADVVEEWRGPPDPLRFARRVYAKLGGLHWVDRIERQAMRDPRVERLPQTRYRSIFRGAPVSATRVNFFFGIGRTLNLAGSLVGSDKLGHFFSQGFKYYRRHRAGWSEDELLARGRYAERWLFGQLTTGVFSNADLVANYEGYLFYRSLFEDDIVPGKPAIIEWLGSGARLRRPFDWRDHVNAYWDEALNPGLYDGLLKHRVLGHLAELCESYSETPEAFVAPDDAELAERYALLRLRDASRYRLDHLCVEQRAAQPEAISRTAARHADGR